MRGATVCSLDKTTILKFYVLYFPLNPYEADFCNSLHKSNVPAFISNYLSNKSATGTLRIAWFEQNILQITLEHRLKKIKTNILSK